MNVLQQAQLASAIRWMITAASAWLVTKGISESTVTGFAALVNPQAVSGFVSSLLPLAWGIWQKHHQNTALLVAANTGQTSAVPTQTALTAVTVARAANKPVVPSAQIKP